MFELSSVVRVLCPLGHEWYIDSMDISFDDLLCKQCEKDKTDRMILPDGTIIAVDNDKLDLKDLLG